MTIGKYFFAWGFNTITRYYLSFIVPSYVESQLNKEYITNFPGWILYGIGILILAPIIEELLFRGIIFQSLAVKQNIFKAAIISAILFVIVHQRYDVIPLFVTGIIYVVLYFKTKQLIMPIVCHFLHNFIVYIRLLYCHGFTTGDRAIPITITEYQQQFIDRVEWSILFVALSAPYLIYFIYQNFPRNNDIEKLPYFANQQTSYR